MVGKFLNFSLLNFWPHAAACRILVLQPGIKPTPPPLAGRLLTSGPLGRSLVGKSHKEKKQTKNLHRKKKNKTKRKLILMKIILVKWKQFNCGFSKIDQRIKLINGVGAFPTTDALI